MPATFTGNAGGGFRPSPLSEAESPTQPAGSDLFRPVMLKVTACSCVLFLFLLFCVFREVRHSRELFRMNQLVLAADMQRQHWQ